MIAARRFTALVITILLATTLWASSAFGQPAPYDRPVDAAPQAKDIGGGYTTPDVQKPLPRSYWLEALDVALLATAMILVSWLVLKKRNRTWLVLVTIGCLGYFGFYREGCVCPIGSIQNVVVALTDPEYSIPILVTALFFLPLFMALFVGRAFCGGVCPLGAIQELVLLKPVRVPRRLDRTLGLLKYVYLGLAIWYAAQPIADRDFVICRFDPFVSIFRRTGFAHMIGIGIGLLALSMFVGRPYCRYLCPYGGLLSWCTRFANRGVTITPDKEIDCGLCADACPYGAIEQNRAVRRSCLYCARCYASCPRTGPSMPTVRGKAVAASDGGRS